MFSSFPNLGEKGQKGKFSSYIGTFRYVFNSIYLNERTKNKHIFDF